MELLDHPLCNATIGAPSDMRENCSPLPVMTLDRDDGRWTVSFWKPSPAELALLNAGGSISLEVRASGRQHPVVGMAVQQPV